MCCEGMTYWRISICLIDKNTCFLLINSLLLEMGNILTGLIFRIRIKSGKNLEVNVVVNEIKDGDFDKKVIRSDQPVLVDMWAPWCGPCRIVAPAVDKLSQKYAGKMHFYKMNIDENPQIPGQYNVMSIPTLLMFKNGKVVDMIVGAVPERAIASKIDAIL